MHFSGKKVLLAVTGGIAAYKSILLLRLLVKQGAIVKVVMTPAARDFVSPLVLGTLSGHEVEMDLFEGDSWANHVKLGRWADVMVVAPATCNTLAKMASGECDNLLLAVYLSATCPVLVCPAMDEDMWKHPTTQRNINTLRKDGVRVMEVEYGELGSGLVGEGRLAEPESIVFALTGMLKYPNRPLLGKKALVTAGPTYEPIDPVRFIGNHSSGKMGIAIANELLMAGAEVTLVLGPTNLKPNSGVKLIQVQTAEEMYDRTIFVFPTTNLAFFAAAVADFRPTEKLVNKWKKEVNGNMPPIRFLENPDILKHCGANKTEEQVVIGFALESQDEMENAMKKLRTKNADWMVLNSLRDEGAGFGGDFNKVTMIHASGQVHSLPLMPKAILAQEILKFLLP